MKDLKIFIDLTRLNRPIGYLLLFWPCSWGLAYAYSFNKNIEIVCYPCPLFDPVWILQDKNTISQYQNIINFDQFFKKTDIDVNIENFFDRLIYAYHWHSRMDATIEKGSYFEKLENDINSKLEKIIS